MKQKASLNKKESIFIKLLLDELSHAEISHEMGITIKEVARIHELIKLKWNTFTDVGITRIAIKEGYYNVFD